VAIVGLGQIGTELAAGLVAGGHVVDEIHRDQLGRLATLSCAAVVLAVPEDVLGEVTTALPPALRDRVVLVQNELVAPTWRALDLLTPTVAVVWFEKKGAAPARPILPTPVAGPHAELIVGALARRSIPAHVIEAGAPLVRALVAKNLYIVASNLAGIGASRNGPIDDDGSVAGLAWPSAVVTMGELLDGHRAFARALATEVFAIELARLDVAEGDAIEFDAAWSVFESATKADPDHKCMGRSAPARLARASSRARELGVDAPIIAALRRETRSSSGPAASGR